MTAHYDAAYFDPKRAIHEFAGTANAVLFTPYIRPTDRVLDFGCSGGYLLSALPGSDKRGVELNPASRAVARERGLTVYESLDEVPDGWADVIVTNHVLEHVEEPLPVARALHAKLRSGGTLVCVIPCETIGIKWVPNHIDQHLYSWSPRSLGNLFTLAGFKVVEAKGLYYKWLLQFRPIQRYLGARIFHFASWLAGLWRREWSQVRLVATKP
jgi:SAM-dependent methyltransferase